MTEKVIDLDCSRMTTRESLHHYLQTKLQLPDYYGRNLDALYDCLTESSGSRLLRLHNTAGLAPLGGYGSALLDTFRDAAKENPALRVEES